MTENTENKKEFELPVPEKSDKEVTAADENRDNIKSEKVTDATSNPQPQAANWPKDKMNEAKNQNGDKKKVDDSTEKINSKPEENESGTAESIENENIEKETREDSILKRPKTETYETNQGDNVGDQIKSENHSHSVEEKNRDEMNRKNRDKTNNKLANTY